MNLESSLKKIQIKTFLIIFYSEFQPRLEKETKFLPDYNKVLLLRE